MARTPAAVVLTSWLAAVPLLSGCGAAVPAAAPRPLRIVSAVQGGSDFTNAMANLYGEAIPDPPRQVLKSRGVVESLEMLEAGEADVGYSLANVAYAGFIGQLPSQDAAFGHLRAMALLRPAALHVLVGPGSPVHAIEDLRGHTVKFSGPGAALAMTAEPVLAAYGLDPGGVGARDTSLPDTPDELLAGQLGALVMLGPPPISLVQTVLAAGGRLLPLQGPRSIGLLREHPFYNTVVLTADAYPELGEPVVTIGVNGVLLCRVDLADDLVYRLTKVLYEGPTGVAVHPALAQWLEPAAGPATPIPLHPGAARYYRERELSP
jgi:TRAP transporter TAXI family solute receptor